MKCQILFSENNKKNMNLLRAEFAHTTVLINIRSISSPQDFGNILISTTIQRNVKVTNTSIIHIHQLQDFVFASNL